MPALRTLRKATGTESASAESVAATASSADTAPSAEPVASAAPAASASAGLAAAASAEPTAAAEKPPIVADNKVEPTEGPELAARAKGLFEAIVNDDPALGEPFWFPKEPFIPLKDVKDPGKYWEQLHKAYANDIHTLHRKHKKRWSGATFTRFERGSSPKWVKPGDEANKIGYYRSFHGIVHYEVAGKQEKLDVHTVITWQGRWYVTHLSKFKK